MACTKNVSGPALYAFLVLFATAVTYGLWVFTEPFLHSLGSAKYLFIPLYLVLGIFMVVPFLASLMVFAALFLTQILALKHIGMGAKKTRAAQKPKPVEYYEYDDESRGYVKRTGYF